MEVKAKECKGNYRVSAEGCGVLTMRRTYGLCQKCYTDWLLNTTDGEIKLEKSRIIGKELNRKKVIAENKAEKKAQKERMYDYKTKLQTVINRIVRMIDYEQPCLARGHHPNQMHAGHIFSRGAEPSMRYNLHNIHRQSAQSNHFQNEDGLLREKLELEYGSKYFEYLKSLRQTPPIKYSQKEFQNLYNRASKIALDFEKEGLRLRSLEERIHLRNRMNLKLGVYSIRFCQYE